MNTWKNEEMFESMMREKKLLITMVECISYGSFSVILLTFFFQMYLLTTIIWQTLF